MINKINWPLIFVGISVIIFFLRFFYPHLSAISTPDFGRTDILHIALPHYFSVSESLHKFQLPLWENRAGFGYSPLEEPVATFFIPNLILLAVLPFNLAIPLIFLTTYLLAACSMYYLLSKLEMDNISSAFGSISFTFSAAMILNTQHLTVAQPVSLIPLALALDISLLSNTNKKYFILLALVLSQILVTFPQLFVYSILIFTIINYFIVFSRKEKKVLKYALIFISVIIFSLILSAGQLFASFQALKQSPRQNSINPAPILSDFPLLTKNLLAFLNPYIVGSASNGSYNSIDWYKKGIFWESTPYIGLLPFLLSIFGTVLILRGKTKKIYIYILISAVLSIALALGKLAPLHILFSFPPLNLFRVPARFIIFTQIFLVIIGAYGFDTILKTSPKFIKKILFLAPLVLILDFYSKWWNYHPIESLKSIEEKPAILNLINNKDIADSKFYSVGTMDQWNEIFTKYGWENKLDYYKFFRNSLEPNLNFFYGINQFSSYQVLATKRQNLQQALIPNFTEITKTDIAFQDAALKAFNIYSIKYLVTTAGVKNNQFEKLGEVSKDNFKYLLYKNNSALEPIRFAYQYLPINNINDYLQAFKNADLTEKVAIENFPKVDLKKGSNEIKINKKTKGGYDFSVSTSNQGLLVISESYSKEWKVKIDGIPTKIYPANINSLAILVPPGIHQINVQYFPLFLVIGLAISATAYIISVIVLLKNFTFTHKKINSNQKLKISLFLF